MTAKDTGTKQRLAQDLRKIPDQISSKIEDITFNNGLILTTYLLVRRKLAPCPVFKRQGRSNKARLIFSYRLQSVILSFITPNQW